MYYDDDGNEIDVSKLPIPKLCLSCEKKDDQYEEVLCNLTRYDQKENAEFVCYAYQDIYGMLTKDLIE